MNQRISPHLRHNVRPAPGRQVTLSSNSADQHRFLAVLADRQGFVVREVDLQQSPKDRFEGVYGPREYARSLLDIFTIFFLVRFTKKPLRFFGMVGATVLIIGTLLMLYLIGDRLIFSVGLANRPALLLSSLLVVLGLQLFALGLLGGAQAAGGQHRQRQRQLDRGTHQVLLAFEAEGVGDHQVGDARGGLGGQTVRNAPHGQVFY